MRDLEVELDEAMSFVENAYKDGAREERALLTEWRDPNKELPEEDITVLVKFNNDTYTVMHRYNHPYLGWGWTSDSVGILADDSQIIGWRPIEE